MALRRIRPIHSLGLVVHVGLGIVVVRCAAPEDKQAAFLTPVRVTLADRSAYSGPAMKLELKPFDFAQAVARAGLRPDGHPLGSAVADPAPAGFGAAMTQALRAVSDSQLEAADMQRELQLDNPTVSLEQTMIAMNKSQLGFTAALTVRNRLVQAYSEIMNMQV